MDGKVPICSYRFLVTALHTEVTESSPTKDALQNKLSNYPFVVSLSNHERMPFDKLRANGVCSCCSVTHPNLN